MGGIAMDGRTDGGGGIIVAMKVEYSPVAPCVTFWNFLPQMVVVVVEASSL